MEQPQLPIKQEGHPRIEAFLTRVLLRLYNDSPAISVYYDDSGLLDEKRFALVFYALPKEVLPSLIQAIGCEKVKVYRFSEGQRIKLAYVVEPTEEEMSDLELYPLNEPRNKKTDGPVSTAA